MRERTAAERLPRQAAGAMPSTRSVRPATPWRSAEKAAGELSTRRAALDEAHARLGEDLAEAGAACRLAEAQLQSAPDLATCRRGLNPRRAAVARDRAALADARAVHDGLKREAEAARAPA